MTNANANVQTLVLVVKTATVLEGCTIQDQRSVVCFFVGQKDSMQRILIKEMCLVYGGKFLSRKSVHNWVDKFFEGRSKVADDARPGAEVAETTDKIRNRGRIVETHATHPSLRKYFHDNDELRVDKLSMLWVLTYW
jgi:hypothetical protein